MKQILLKFRLILTIKTRTNSWTIFDKYEVRSLPSNNLENMIFFFFFFTWSKIQCFFLKASLIHKYDWMDLLSHDCLYTGRTGMDAILSQCLWRSLGVHSSVTTSVQSPAHARGTSDESALWQVVDECCVDEFVLGNSLHHQHPLLPQVGQHLGGDIGEVILRQIWERSSWDSYRRGLI